MSQIPYTAHTFTNYRKLVSLADHDWETAETGKIAGLNVEIKSANRMLDQYGRAFHHFCTTSYLGLDHHPDILDGAMTTLWETGTLRIANSKHRCKLAILDQYEIELSELFGASCLSALSCSAASAGKCHQCAVRSTPPGCDEASQPSHDGHRHRRKPHTA